MHDNVTARVQRQYEQHPYPERNPADEGTEFQAHTQFYGADRIIDQCFGGELDIRNGKRVLIAGGGTGDGLVSIGEQLRHTSSEIVYVDISAHSLDIARQRAERRRIPNIRWHQGSLLDLPADIGVFDHIDSVGVLHHLEDPQAGLQALADVLHPNGSMGLLVYGKYGRAKIYQTREKIRAHLTPGMTPDKQLAIARQFLHDHPEDNPDVVLRGERMMTDANLRDLLLHEQDEHPFTVPMIHTWLGAAGLQLVSFVDTRWGGGFAYNPQFYTSGTDVDAIVEPLSPKQQERAERLSGKIALHSLYAAKRANTAALSDRPDMIPSFSVGIGDKLRRQIIERIAAEPDTPLPIARLTNGAHVKLRLGLAASTLLQQMDGAATNSEIVSRAATVLQEPTDRLRKELTRLLDSLRHAGWVSLRHRSLQPFVTAEELQRQQLRREGTTDQEPVVLDVGAQTIGRLLAGSREGHTFRE